MSFKGNLGTRKQLINATGFVQDGDSMKGRGFKGQAIQGNRVICFFMVSVISPATVSQFFFIPHQDCLVPLGKPWDAFVCACVFLSKNNNKKCGWGWFVIFHCGFESWMISAQLQKLGLSVKPPSLRAKQQSMKRKPWRNNGQPRRLFIVVLQIHLNDRMENGPRGIQIIFSSWPRSFLRTQFSFLPLPHPHFFFL